MQRGFDVLQQWRQDLQRAGQFVLTAIDRRELGSSVRVLEPRDGVAVEVASLSLPAGNDVVSFASAYAGDGSTVAVGSADMRFNLKEQSVNRARDPKVFLWSRQGTAWSLDGFVKSPAPANGAPADARWFGASLAVSGDVLAVGSPATLPPRPSEVLPRSGFASVNVFRRSGGRWMPEVQIQGMTVTRGLCFGIDVALEGDLLAVRGFDPEQQAEPAGGLEGRHRVGALDRRGAPLLGEVQGALEVAVGLVDLELAGNPRAGDAQLAGGPHHPHQCVGGGEAQGRRGRVVGRGRQDAAVPELERYRAPDLGAGVEPADQLGEDAGDTARVA